MTAMALLTFEHELGLQHVASLLSLVNGVGIVGIRYAGHGWRRLVDRPAYCWREKSRRPSVNAATLMVIVTLAKRCDVAMARHCQANIAGAMATAITPIREIGVTRRIVRERVGREAGDIGGLRLFIYAATQHTMTRHWLLIRDIVMVLFVYATRHWRKRWRHVIIVGLVKRC